MGGGIAVLGHLIRIVAVVLEVANPSGNFQAVVVAGIPFMLVGMAILSVTVVRGGRLVGWQKWMPVLVTAAAFVAAMFFSIDKVIHFILLGLLWGAGWLAIGYVVVRQAGASSRRG